MEKKTPLYDRHLARGGKIVPFAGWLLPVQYTNGIIAEHLAVRRAAGLFDVSHMGEFLLSGAGALEDLNRLLTNDFGSMTAGQVRYSPMCNSGGGVVDDLLVYKISGDRYLLVVNAANREKDAAWIRGALSGKAEFTDLSDDTAELALQGPRSEEILRRLAGPSSLPSNYYHFVPESQIAGIPCLISRTGYTGEAGFEIYLPSQAAQELWDRLLEAGEDLGLVPCGLGARDTLRFEAAMPLYGHEMDETINPLEAGLGFAVKLDKGDFSGKQALLSWKERAASGAPVRKRTGLKVRGQGIVREGAPIFSGDTQVGISTSGTFCPGLNYAAAMALVDSRYSRPGLVLTAEVRGRQIETEVVELPFYIPGSFLRAVPDGGPGGPQK